MGFNKDASWVKQAIQNGLIPPDDVRTDRTSPEVHVVKQVVSKDGPTDVDLVLWAVEQAGFGRPIPEFRFHEKRKWRFDWAWAAYRVAFEREGGVWRSVNGSRILLSRHRSEAGYDADCEKYNAAAVAGWLTIRATPQMIADGRALVGLLEALSARRGEPPPVPSRSGKEVA